MRRFVVGLLIIVGVLSLLVASTSLWTRRQVINTEVFVSTAQQVVADPAVQERITSQAVDSIMTNPDVQQAVNEFVATLPPRVQVFRPAVAEGARNILSSGVHTLLTSQLFSTVTGAVLTSAQTQLVNGEDVRFTLGQAKALVPPEQQTGLAGQVLNLIPNDAGITVVTKADAPQLYTALDLLKSAWLWVGLIAIAALIGALVLSRNRRKTLRAFAVTTIVGCLLLALALKLARGPLLGNVKPLNVSAVDSIYGLIANSLLSWTLWLAAIMAVIVVVTLLWGRIGIVPAIGRGARAVRQQASDYRVSRAAAKQAAAESGQDVPREPWFRRMAIATSTFFAGLGLSDQLASLAGLIAANLRVARWTGVVIGALILLFWPSPTLSVLIWVAAGVALYLGLLELVLAVGRPADTAETAMVGGPDGGSAAAAVPVAAGAAALPEARPAHADGTPGSSATVPVPATPTVPTAPAGAPMNAGTTPPPETPPPPKPPPPSEEDQAIRRRATAQADLSTMGDRLDLLDRLSSAHTAGVLTDEEFKATKANVLGV